jgi:A/G-specific adenine glycosylase
MLQQTRVAAVVDRYQTFMARFPTLVSLALAAEEEVLALWSGLGYYRRARMLHKAAQFVARRYQGNLPASSAELRLLPGIGVYTAAAIASIAHGEPVAAVDGNVERVLCRLQGWDAEGSRGGGAVRRKVEALAIELLDTAHPGDFNQALMELGAILCLPRNPLCPACPVASDCRTQGEHKRPARPAMERREVAHALSIRHGAYPQGGVGSRQREVLLEQRPRGLTVMPDLWELPRARDAVVPEPELLMTVRHTVMQVNYRVRIRAVVEDEIEGMAIIGGARRWVPLGEAGSMALTGLTRKVLSRARLLPATPDDAIAALDKEAATR